MAKTKLIISGPGDTKEVLPNPKGTILGRGSDCDVILDDTGVKEQTGIDFKSTAGDSTWNPVDAFLEKPVEPDVLLQEIEKLLPDKT